MGNKKIYLNDQDAKLLLGKVNKNKKYRLSEEERKVVEEYKAGNKDKTKLSNNSDTKPNDYIEEEFVLTAWNYKKGCLFSIEEYCKEYNMNYADVTSYKFLPHHYKEPTYHIVFKENVLNAESIDFDKILSKYKNFEPKEETKKAFRHVLNDFSTLTYTDVHIAMDTNADGNSMYAEKWDKGEILNSLEDIIKGAINNSNSNTLVIDELGDFLDGLNGYTTRGGHKLPQNMTDEEAFDLAVWFKIELIDRLHNHFNTIIVNNICNDNHAGSFGYFVNSAAKNIIENKYDNVTVTNHRQFINHYYVGDICFLITHGKDDKNLKFGFKPQLDSKGLEKIDQYCKQNDIYKHAKKIVFKKGDSHQALFDMCTSDDFYYFNYPALSPSSQWVQNNFKKGRRGFVLETWNDLDVNIKPIFL